MARLDAVEERVEVPRHDLHMGGDHRLVVAGDVHQLQSALDELLPRLLAMAGLWRDVLRGSEGDGRSVIGPRLVAEERAHVRLPDREEGLEAHECAMS